MDKNMRILRDIFLNIFKKIIFIISTNKHSKNNN
jgi:hypothetical protein